MSAALAELFHKGKGDATANIDIFARNGEQAAMIQDSKLVAIYSLKGGVGKTTLSVNLAAESALRRGKKTLLWDLDLVASDAKTQEGPIEKNQRLLSEIKTRFSLYPDEKDGIRRQLEARWNGVSGTPESSLFYGVAVAYVTDDSDLAKTVYNQAPRKSWRRAALILLVTDDLLKAKCQRTGKCSQLGSG